LEALPLGGPPLVVDGRYEVEAVVGHGGMGIVYLARDIGLGRAVALKMIAPRWLGDGAVVQLFQREAKALASIRSQYVVQVHAFGLHEGSCFFAMEYVRGRSLRQILAEHRAHGDTIPLHRTLTILLRVAQGIDAVHAAGIVHRDVKPSNIVIEEDTGRPVLVDFGLAMPSADHAAALAIGTPQYMAPEQAGVGVPGAVVTARTDVYSLAITAFEMLTSELPFDSKDLAQLMRRHARKKPPSLSSVRRDLGVFDKAIARALAKDPEERFASCTAFAEVLGAAGERWITSTLPTLPPPDTGAHDTLAIPRPGGVPALAAAGEPFHALVVDDSPVFRRFTVQATQVALYRRRKDLRVVVEGAGSGHEALERAVAQPPDLVLLDFDMPGLDGVDTLSRLRALPGGGQARVVVLSGRVAAADRWRFAVLGVNDFVAKPIDFRRLVDRIEAIAARLEETGRLRVR
jgi:CheY-like chemotaxis protein/predicted Ser/Thr protein kinase